MSAKSQGDVVFPRMIPVCWVACDGVFVEAAGTGVPYAYSVEGEIIDAAGFALVVQDANPDSVVTLVFGTVWEGSQ